MNANLEAEFSARALHRGGLMLLSPKDAIALIRRAQVIGTRILGVDGFRVFSEGIQPDTEHTLDLSPEKKHTGDAWLMAENFIAERRDAGLHFEVVLG